MFNSLLIGISGNINAGKDSVADILINLAKVEGLVCEKRKFAQKVKEQASILLGVHISKFEDAEFKNKVVKRYVDKSGEVKELTVRDYLIGIGNGLRKVIHEDIWVDLMFNDYQSTDRWVISDVRYPNEFEAIKKLGGIMVYVKRKNSVYLDNESERSLDNYLKDNRFDYVIYNDATKYDLVQSAKKIFDDINFDTI
jgi:hypothetical protein